MNDDIIKYYNSCFLDAMIFSLDSKKYFTEDLVRKDLIKQLKEKVLSLYKKGAFNEQARYNLLELINFLRFENADFGVENNDDINALIRLINKIPNDDFAFMLYLFHELYIRIGDVNENLCNAVYIYEMIEFDFKVLQSLLCSDESFEKMLLDTGKDQLCLNQRYFFSINKLIHDITQLFENDKCLNRVMTVLEINSKYKNNNKDNTINFSRKDLKRFRNNNRIMQKKLMK